MLDCWEVARVLFGFECFFFFLSFQRRTVLNRMEPHYLALCMLIASIDQNVVIDILDPIEILEKRDMLINEDSSMLLQHSSHQHELAELYRDFLIEAERANVLKGAFDFS